MGCQESTLHSKSGRNGASKGSENVFGKGVHIGRAGNVDLTGRNMDFLGTNIVKMINKDGLHRTATSLTLSENRLYTLGKEMSLLPKLEEIDMDNNRFQRLPESLALPKMLWRVNVSNNPIDAHRGFDMLPRLLALRSLSIRECNLTCIPSAILACSLLEELDLSGNVGMHCDDVSFAQLTNLATLKVAGCGLEGRSLPSGIKRLTSLRSLDISANRYTFEDPDFFGSDISQTLHTLALRAMELSSVPPVVVTLTRLYALDLSENPIETLDVLAGRLVKRLQKQSSTGTMQPLPPLANGGAPQTAPVGTVAVTSGNTVRSNDVDDSASIFSEGRLSNSSRISISKLSKAGMIAPVATPIPIKKLSLRACHLRTMPKYFHKMSQLEELDLSENENLDDPNMTLFSLINLRVLNIIGCPFAEDPTRSRNEWFDIAKLRNLSDLQWELWMGNHNMSPYRTKIPIEVCNLKLKRLNQVQLRNNLFMGDAVETAINLLSDGYFKVNLSVDDDTLYSYVDAVRCFAAGKEFFFPKDVNLTEPIAHSEREEGNSRLTFASGAELGRVHLSIALDRYVFFLAMQAANYDAIIIPPIDVMIIHYAQITNDPVKYRADCKAICGRILNCNYRFFFIEHRNPSAVKDAVAASKKIWNLMVRSAQKDLAWLRYDFWDKRAKLQQGPVAPLGSFAASASSEPQSPLRTEFAPVQRLQGLPTSLIGGTKEELFDNFKELQAMALNQELCSVLDSSITSHFLEQGIDPFRASIVSFYEFGNTVLAHESTLRSLPLDWTRYVKFLTLHAYRLATHRNNSSACAETTAEEEGNLYAILTPSKTATSLLGPHYDNLVNNSFVGPNAYLPMPQTNPETTNGTTHRSLSALVRRSAPVISSTGGKDRKDGSRRRAVLALESNPVPTIGITLLLHAHRTSHVKYVQTLSLLGIDDTDVTWENSAGAVEQTQRCWQVLYNESYVGDTPNFSFILHNDGVVMPMVRSPNGQVTNIPFTATLAKKLQSPVYLPGVQPVRSLLRSTFNRSNKKVMIIGGDTEYGVF